jgi:hypothetical protein
MLPNFFILVAYFYFFPWQDRWQCQDKLLQTNRSFVLKNTIIDSSKALISHSTC